MTEYVNELFRKEGGRLDYIFLRPVLIVLYFFLRVVLFPFKFLFHREPWGFENRCIDAVLGFGIKYMATQEALELFIRHVQIEPLNYRFLLCGEKDETTAGPLHGIDGDYSIESVAQLIRDGLTIPHDDLSYEVIDRFDRDKFFENLEQLRSSRPEDHDKFSKAILEENKKHSFQLFGCTNVVIFVVMTITIFGDLRSVVRALNSFGSDSLLLWCVKNLYRDDVSVLIDLVFFMPNSHNRSHYNSSAFFSDPSQYLYHHIAFHEYVYNLLREGPPGSPSQSIQPT